MHLAVLAAVIAELQITEVIQKENEVTALKQ